MKHKRLLALMLLNLLTLATCSRLPFGGPPTPLSGPEATEAGYPPPAGEGTPAVALPVLPVQPETPALTPTVEVALPVLPQRTTGLATNGPWLLLAGEADLWIANPDGSGRTTLADGGLAGSREAEGLAASQGQAVAYLTSSGGFRGLTLHVLSVPDLTPRLTLPLTSPKTEPGPEASPGDRTFEAARAIAELESLAWSPDGDRLAFIGAHQGPTADLYLYSLTDGEVRRLSDGPAQAIKPSWSPDGRYIVHAGVSSLGTGAGYGMLGVWAAPADGSAVRELPLPAGSGDEIWLGWADRDTLLVYSFNAVCGYQNLRALRVDSGETRALWAGAFDGAAFDPNSGRVLLSVPEISPECAPAEERGLILTHAAAQDRVVVFDEPARTLTWSSTGARFLASTGDGMISVRVTGEVEPLRSELDAPPVYAPDGTTMAWIEEGGGVWISGDGQAPRQIFGDSAQHPFWSPEGKSLYFFSDGGLYRSDLSTEATLVLDVGGIRSVAWMTRLP